MVSLSVETEKSAILTPANTALAANNPLCSSEVLSANGEKAATAPLACSQNLYLPRSLASVSF
eukprot:4716515-Prorocentrum_lima.AAC.1